MPFLTRDYDRMFEQSKQIYGLNTNCIKQIIFIFKVGQLLYDKLSKILAVIKRESKLTTHTYKSKVVLNTSIQQLKERRYCHD